jgi:hypothetical protein
LKISDFGLAKWLPTEWSHRAVAPIEGTFGLVSKLKKKLNIFSNYNAVLVG